MNTTPDDNDAVEDSTTTNTTGVGVVDLSRSRRWQLRMPVRQLRMLATGAHGGDRALRQHLLDSIKHSLKYSIVREERHSAAPTHSSKAFYKHPPKLHPAYGSHTPPGETTRGSESVQ